MLNRHYTKQGKIMTEIYEGRIIMEPDEMIGNVLDLMDIVITGEAIHNLEKGFFCVYSMQ